MSESSERAVILKRAFGYPYELTHTSFVFQAGSAETHRLVARADDFPDVSGRIPVLAVGSNQSPAQLARKFPFAAWGEIPTSRVHLQDFDTVFSAHITGYGSIAAMLFPSPGTRVALYVNWLNERQLEAMHKTELPNENYHFGRLENLELSVEAGPALSAVHLYVGQRGAYAPGGFVVPLAEVPAEGRHLEAKSQKEILEMVRAQVQPGLRLEDFIISAIECPDNRLTYIEALAASAQRFETENYRAGE